MDYVPRSQESHAEGIQKAGGCMRKLAEVCERGPRALSSRRRSRSPRSSDGNLNVVESTLISTKGIIPNPLIGEGFCLVGGAGRAGSGSDGAGLDELKGMLLFTQLKLRKADWFIHGMFRFLYISDTLISHNW